MSLLNSKFDIVSVDNPLALAALAQVLESPTGMTLGPNGTPLPGTIPPGSIVEMGNDGKAQLATTANVTTNLNKKMVFVALDGDQDYAGSFVKKITVLHGGFTMVTDVFDANGVYAPGVAVTFRNGKIAQALETDQFIGFVGPQGLKDGVVQILVPQGCGI